MERKLKAGIIGTGKSTGIASGHLNGYLSSSDVELIGVYNTRPETSRTWCEANGLSESLIYTSGDKLIEDADIISICTPNYTHVEYIKKCLAAGTNVLCEKPLSNTTEDWPELEGLLEKSKSATMINFNYRYLPGVRMMHELVENGDLGKIYMIRHNMGAPRLANENVPMEWRFVKKLSGTGALTDFGSHALDMLRYVVGENDLKFTSLSARKATYIKERAGKDGMQKVENDDAAMVLATIGEDTMYSLMLSRVGTAPSVMEIIAERGIVRFDLSKPCEIIVQARQPGSGYSPAEIRMADTGEQWKNNKTPAPYIACAEAVKSFVQMIRDGVKPETDIYYGYSILKDIEAIDKAAETA